jgi:hypothetical protein
MSPPSSRKALNASAASVHDGSLRQAESLLVGQAVALNAIFTSLALQAKRNMGEYLDDTRNVGGH